MHLIKGSKLKGGCYQIVKTLGQGGFGITYSASDLSGKIVCIKEFFIKDFCAREESSTLVSFGNSSNGGVMERFRAKFIKEAKMLSRLNHPNIVHVIDIFEENGTAYYVMDFIDGKPLNEVVKLYGSIPEKTALKYIKDVCAGLRYMHEQKVLHLDIKPGNIVVRNDDERAILIDFGISKQYDDNLEQTSSSPLANTEGYAPIEQTDSSGLVGFSPQTDIYAVGATLFNLLTGIKPPAASVVMDEGLPEFPKGVSSSVAAAIVCAMSPRRADRPSSVEEFLSLLSGTRMSEDDGENTVIISDNDSTSISETTTFTFDYSAYINEYGDLKSFLTKAEVKKLLPILESATAQSDFSATVLLSDLYERLGRREESIEKALEATRTKDKDLLERAQFRMASICVSLPDRQDESVELLQSLRRAENLHVREQAELFLCSLAFDEVELRKLQKSKFSDISERATLFYANNLIEEERYAEALKVLSKVDGDFKNIARGQMGFLQCYGLGVKQNYRTGSANIQACTSFLESVVDRDWAHMFQYAAILYSNNDFYGADASKSLKYYQIGAERGNSDCMLETGRILLSGSTGAKDLNSAVKLLSAAAEEGNVEAKQLYRKAKALKDNTLWIEVTASSVEQMNPSVITAYFNVEATKKDYTKSLVAFAKYQDKFLRCKDDSGIYAQQWDLSSYLKETGKLLLYDGINANFDFSETNLQTIAGDEVLDIQIGLAYVKTSSAKVASVGLASVRPEEILITVPVKIKHVSHLFRHDEWIIIE